MNSGIPSGEYKHTYPHSPSAPDSRSFSPAFTLVELLLVIVIIAILATITIVAFNGIQDRARASAVSAALNQASKKLELYSVDNGGYPAALSDAGVTDSNNVSYQYTASTAPSATYCTTATQGSTSYYISNTTKTPTKGGCPGHGQGGVAAITNLATNPSIAVGTSGWNGVVSTGGAYTGSRVTSVSGLSSLGVTTAYRSVISTAPATWWRNRFSYIPITAGQTYTFSTYIRTSVSVPTTAIIIWYNSSKSYLSETGSAASTQTAMTWERKSVTGTAPATAAYAGLDSNATTGGTVGAYIDSTAQLFTEGSSVYGYADGTSTNWVWNGAANASTSTGPAL